MKQPQVYFSSIPLPTLKVREFVLTLNRKSPTGGSAYGIPKKVLNILPPRALK